MEFSHDLDFDHRDRKDIYEYVERFGVVDPTEARRVLAMNEEAFGHHVAVLKRDGILARTDDGELRIAFEDDELDVFSLDEIEVTIRQATEDDLTGLVGAIRSALSDRTYVDGEAIADVVDYENVLLRHNDLKSRIFFVASVRGDVVGWVHIDAPEIETLSHTAQLTVGVIEAYRGRGIGSKLHERGVAWADEHGFEKLYNSVPSTNEAAIEFLRARGWDVEAIREDHYRIDDEYVDEVMMANVR
ncbi:MAG: N-acetyltransferase family protein [Natronomonas sp.]